MVLYSHNNDNNDDNNNSNNKCISTTKMTVIITINMINCDYKDIDINIINTTNEYGRQQWW